VATWGDAERCLMALPATEVGTSYGTPAIRVGRRLVARLREDGETLVVHAGQRARAALLGAADPAFFTLPHYDGPESPYVLVRLPTVRDDDLVEVLTDAWAQRAPARVVAAWRAGQAGQSG
jgi:hypothetical protein